MKNAQRIQFVDAFVRRRYWVMVTMILGIMVSLYSAAMVLAPPQDMPVPMRWAIGVVTTLMVLGVLYLFERYRRRHYGLYVQPHGLLLNFHNVYLLELQPNAKGTPLVIIRVVGRRYEITTASQKKAIYLPVAAIPTLPQILIHYDLDVKLIE